MADDVVSAEFIPNFNRSTVYGFAVKASDIQGSSDAIPAILTCVGETSMGEMTDLIVSYDQCVIVPTGGEVPEDADAVVMLEYVEAIGDHQYAFYKPSAPGSNIILRGEDGKPNDVLITQGKQLTPADLGTLSVAGHSKVCVYCRPKVGIVSTGDELVPTGDVLKPGQIRDVNQPLLCALVEQFGGQATFFGIVKDNHERVLKNKELTISGRFDSIKPF